MLMFFPIMFSMKSQGVYKVYIVEIDVLIFNPIRTYDVLLTYFPCEILYHKFGKTFKKYKELFTVAFCSLDFE